MHDLENAFLAAFGQRGSAFTLAFDREGKHLPCELAAGLSHDQAKARAALLQAAGAVLQLVPTSEVVGVKHRAEECWPTHQALSGESFSLIDGLVLTLSPLNARENLAILRQRSPKIASWELELALNHQHPTHDFNRAALRIARRDGADCARDLQECFPKLSFVLVYRDELFSFCQRNNALPLGVVPKEPVEKKQGWCEHCQTRVGYLPRTTPDPEFPHARFADCGACGEELLLWTLDETVLVDTVPEAVVLSAELDCGVDRTHL